jgi:hypothetical protein
MSRAWSLPLFCAALLICLAPGVADAAVSAYRALDSGSLLGGSGAEGLVNDYVIENDRIVVVIASPGHAVGDAVSGGNIIDAGTSTGRLDALGEMHCFLNSEYGRQPMSYQVLVIDDGSGGGPAILRASGFDFDDTSIAVVTEYSLADGDDHLRVTTTITNNGATSYPAYGMGDQVAWGDAALFAPGDGFIATGSGAWPWLAASSPANLASYGYLSPLGDVAGGHGGGGSTLLVDEAPLPPAGVLVYERDFLVGDGDVAAVAAIVHEMNGTAVGSVQASVTRASNGDPFAGASIDAFDAGDTHYLSMATGEDGLADATLPPGDWRLVAGAPEHHDDEVEISLAVGQTLYPELSLLYDDSIPPVADTLTVIQRPLLNIPTILAPGDTLDISCEAGPGVTGWVAELRYEAITLPLSIVSASHDASTGWWTLRAPLQSPELYELYDLHVSADGGIDDSAANAVSILPAFKDDYYFVHITDTHIPTHLYVDDPGSETDSTSTIDLREVFADIELINPEFLLLTGDLVNEGELEDYLYRRYYSRSQRLLGESRVPIYLTAGNHDLGGWSDTPPADGTARRDWWRFYGWPRLDDPPPGAPARTQDYSFDYGPVHYVGLEAYDNYDWWRYSIYGATSFISDQLLWLGTDLAAATAAGSTSQVLFYHYDFKHEMDLSALGVEMALWGHNHSNTGSIYTQPYDLSTKNTSRGNRAYRLIRVSNGVLAPTNALSAGYSGNNLRVQYSPANDGSNLALSATVTNNQAQGFEHGRLRLLLPKQNGTILVTGGTLTQVDRSGEFAVCYVDANFPPGSSTQVDILLDATPAEGAPMAGLRLAQNFPNPFNPRTTFAFSLPCAGQAELTVVDVQGREVARLLEGEQPAGPGSVTWDAGELASGLYLVRLDSCGGSLTRKITLAR